MEVLILSLIPGLVDYPFLLIITEICFAMFFGGFVFSGFWNLIITLLGGRK